tara:strand:- start:22729 stop:23331 length:603 start_codon:yes stop_codon:yes gene_type:complete
MFIIGVTGGTGSGKSTLIEKIIKSSDSQEICFLSSDSYYKDNSILNFEERDKLNYDIPSAVDFDLLNNHLSSLKMGNQINVPKYCFSTHMRLKSTISLLPKKILILEGILILTNKELRDQIDYKVYLDCPRKLRFERRIKRDMSERGRSYDDVVNLFDNRLDQMHDLYVDPIKKYCNLILDSSTEVNFSKLTDIISQNQI